MCDEQARRDLFLDCIKVWASESDVFACSAICRQCAFPTMLHVSHGHHVVNQSCRNWCPFLDDHVCFLFAVDAGQNRNRYEGTCVVHTCLLILIRCGNDRFASLRVKTGRRSASERQAWLLTSCIAFRLEVVLSGCTIRINGHQRTSCKPSCLPLNVADEVDCDRTPGP